MHGQMLSNVSIINDSERYNMLQRNKVKAVMNVTLKATFFPFIFDGYVENISVLS